MKGVRVDATHSNISSVCLSSVSTTTTGRFRCEVSEEAPSFATDSKFGDLLVVVVPNQPPTISGAQAREGRLHTATVGLHHKLTRQDFRHGNGVKFKCVASIYDAYYKVNEISAERGRRRRRVSGRRSLGQAGGRGLVQVGGAAPLPVSVCSSFFIILTWLWPLDH